MKKKRFFAVTALVAMLVVAFAGCNNAKETGGENPTTEAAKTPEAEENKDITPTEGVTPSENPEAAGTPTPIPVSAEPKMEAFDAEGRVNAVYGTPVLDGEIDAVWGYASSIFPEVFSTPSVYPVTEWKVLWDENYLYVLTIVEDDVLNKSGMNTYEQDSMEIFLDELNDKAGSYQEDDVHYRVNYANSRSTDAGDPTRFISAARVLKDEDDYETGYVIEAAVAWNGTPINGTVMGFDLQLNDAGMMNSRMSTTNVFDATGTGWQNPSVFGELILTCKEGDEGKVVKSQLEGFIKQVGKYNLTLYANPEVLDTPKQKAQELLASETATQEEVDTALAELKAAVAQLNDGSGYVSAKNLEAVEALPDPYQFLDGTYVETAEDWEARAEELNGMYQYYMYGVWRDGTGENVSYELNGASLKITVEREDRTAAFTVTVSVPDAAKCEMPAGGWPVIVGMHGGIQENVALENGYAVIILNTYEIASDDNKHTGAFYQLYPYGESWKEQTGVLLAWSWGASKVLDALEAGLGAELSINSENSIITGVSRWGKAAAVCGAFETRFKLVAPSCSGAGGLAVYRYTSEGKTYDFTSKGVTDAYTYTQNEPLGSLQATGEQGWFNDMFLNFSDVTYLPVDQYMLASLCADEDRYLFIIGSCVYEDWVNAPSMYLCYKAANSIFDFLGLEDHIAVNIHKEGHAVIEEDMRYIIDYFNYHVYGKEPTLDLENLKTSVFEEDANYDPLFDEFNKEWYR